MQKLSFAGVLGRFAASLLLVLLTYNPTGHSYLHWMAADFPHLTPLQAVLGLALLGVWLFFLHATWRSLGAVGLAIGAGICAALVWLFTSWGWFSLSKQGALAWVVLLVIACLITLGLCWALIQARVSGQSVVEEVRS
ncbi:MAG: DUF6524 family protein [Steroidobacteraceae bacterium]